MENATLTEPTSEKASPENGEYIANAGEKAKEAASDAPAGTQNEADRLYAQWIFQGEELKKTCPGFSPEKDFSDPEMLSLLKAGLDVKSAYYALRHEELLESAVRDAEIRGRMAAASEIKAQSLRPRENGNSDGASKPVSRDVFNMTPAEIREIIKKAESGVKITF